MQSASIEEDTVLWRILLRNTTQLGEEAQRKRKSYQLLETLEKQERGSSSQAHNGEGEAVEEGIQEEQQFFSKILIQEVSTKEGL